MKTIIVNFDILYKIINNKDVDNKIINDFIISYELYTNGCKCENDIRYENMISNYNSLKSIECLKDILGCDNIIFN